MKRLQRPVKTLLMSTILTVSLLAPDAIADNECSQFRVVGVCIWIICTNFGCDIDVTIKYGHFNPDVIVTVNNPDGIDRVEDPKRIADDTYNRNHNNLIFQSAAAYGHPLTGQIYCPSITDAGDIYFKSSLDIPAWRWGSFDSLTVAAILPGQREIGNWPKYYWGHLYPRTGWNTQHSEPKAAAVVAQRVGDILTRSSEPHIYSDIVGQSIFIEDEKFTWSPGELVENTNEEGWFQMMSPEFEQCTVFGEDDTTDQHGWGGGRVADDGDYIFALWRPYTCCEFDDGFLIDIDFIPFPSPVITND
jgi:integrating conjugative element protein (TIGR03756 family)